jgi:hypothetical protein
MFKTTNNFIKKIKNKKKLGKKLNNIIFVADIETTIINNKHIPIIIGYKNINNNFEKIIIIKNIKNIYEESKLILYNFLNDFIKLSKKHKKITIYFHNLGAFDGIFLLNIINEYSDIYPFNKTESIIRNNKIYEIKILNINIRDSYNLFPLSLKKLSKELLEKEY